jgi:hypothetical protein
MPFASRPFNFTTNYIKYSDTVTQAAVLTPLYTPTINELALIYLTHYGPKFKAGALANSNTNTKSPKNVGVIVIHRSFSKLFRLADRIGTKTSYHCQTRCINNDPYSQTLGHLYIDRTSII